jgi:hypothetical protein
MPTWQTADLAIAMDRSAYLNLDRGSSELSSDGRKRGNTKTFAISSDGSGRIQNAVTVQACSRSYKRGSGGSHVGSFSGIVQVAKMCSAAGPDRMDGF